MQFVFLLSVTLSVAVALPVDPFEHKLLAAPALSYHAPAVSYAAPAYTKVLAPAPTLTKYVSAPALALPAPKFVAAAPTVVKTVEPEPYDPNPQYSFSYGVTDHHTGDSKSQEETLVDGVVHGSYSLTEPDGTLRKVSFNNPQTHPTGA